MILTFINTEDAPSEGVNIQHHGNAMKRRRKVTTYWLQTYYVCSVQFSSVQSLSRVRLFARSSLFARS